ncbi:MAG: hypothetical protein ACI80V_001989 [Rhodothermales bacterium]|jgi:hypothetical protein
MNDRQQGRNYNEREIGKLIQRATELHEASIGQSDRNLSLEEIEQLAAELGVPAEHLHTAALELDTRPDKEEGFSLWGGPFVVDHDRAIPATMTEEQWGHVLLEIRRFMGKTGHDSKVGPAWEWFKYVGEGESGVNFESTRMTMEPGERGTTLRIRKQFGGAAFLAYVVSLAPAAVISGVLLGEPLGPLNMGVMALTLALPVAMRALIKRSKQKKEKSFKQLGDRLQEILGAPPATEALVASAVEDLSVEPTKELLEIPDRETVESSAGTDQQETRVRD